MILLHHRTSSFRTTLTLGLVVAVSVLPGIARACPFCSAVSLTFSQEIEQSRGGCRRSARHAATRLRR